MKRLEESFIENQNMEGWVTIGPLSEILKTSSPILRQKLIKYRQSNPEWIRMAKNGKRTDEFFSPELQKKLKEELKPEIKGEWLTTSAMRKKGHVPAAEYIIQSKLVEIIRENQDLVNEVIIRGNPVKIYSPVVIELIKKALSEDFAPPGWSYMNQLIKDLSTYKFKILSIVKPYRISNPEWFKQYRAKEITTEHFSPELTDIIIKTLKVQKEESFFDFEKFKIEVRQTKIGTSSAYDEMAPDKGWPSYNWLVSQPFWVELKEAEKDPWAELFGENRIVRYSKPVIRQKAKEKVKAQLEIEKNGWQSVHDFAKSIGKTEGEVLRFLENRKTGAAHIKEENVDGVRVRFLSEPLQDVIKEEI
jgi:hypothetical protein